MNISPKRTVPLSYINRIIIREIKFGCEERKVSFLLSDKRSGRGSFILLFLSVFGLMNEAPLFLGKKCFSSSDEGQAHNWVGIEFLMKNSSTFADDEVRVWAGNGFLMRHHTVLKT